MVLLLTLCPSWFCVSSLFVLLHQTLPEGGLWPCFLSALTLENPYTLIPLHATSLFKVHFSFGSSSPTSLIDQPVELVL